ncbi:hypothetical protein [Zavarzinella formosa]|uniref:hypothetical protein n=1 Tax=Zavarzinella formosa TaxID=360055 RepID=UPI0002FFB67E|nr:hypothetical protein [Zavarzinella formosa]
MNQPSITFVTCAESGALEGPPRRLAASLRKWGGRFANCPLYAVTPRFGAPLSSGTIREFRDLGVKYLRFSRHDGYEWNPYVNKLAAVKAVEDLADTEAVAWLDADLFVVGEPHELELAPDEDFLASPSDAAGTTSGPGDLWEEYWQETGKLHGIDINSMPWVNTHREGKRIRYSVNGGLFVYRKTTKFGTHYHDFCMKWLDAKFGSIHTKVFFHDQQALSLVAHQQGLRIRHLNHSHNYEMASSIHAEWFREEKLRAAKIVHYHDCMWPKFWPTFLEVMRPTHPEAAAWLAERGPLKNEAKPWWKVFGKWLQKKRQKTQAAYLAGCRLIETGK